MSNSNSIAQPAESTKTDAQRRTEAATFARTTQAALKQQRRFEAMVAKSQAADPHFNWETGLLLAV